MILPVMVDYAPLVTGSLVARAVVAACVAGLLGTSVRPRWVAAVLGAGAALAGFLVLWPMAPLYADVRGLAAGVAIAAGLACGVSALREVKPRTAEFAALGVVLLIAVWFSGFLPGTLHGEPARARDASLAQAPQPEKYAFDGAGYVRTYYLMKQGVGYYDAFAEAQIEDSRHDATVLKSPFNYREPLVFEIWRALPGSDGSDLFAWFVVWSLATMVAAYLLAAQLTEPGAALLAPIALVAYFFFFWWSGTWFTFTEVWASGFAVAAVAALARRQRVASLVLLTLSVASREFMIVLIPAWLVAWWLWAGGPRRASWWFPVAAVAAPAAALGIHLLLVPPLAPGGGGLAAWLHGGPSPLIAALRFGWPYVPGAKWVPLAVAAAAVASAALARPRWRTAALLAATVLPTIFLIALSLGQWGDYWGAFYTPLAVGVAAGLLGRVLPPPRESTGAG
ncbi:MAG: hypothetical protein WCN81_08725 [Actinomycetes bacterium]